MTVQDSAIHPDAIAVRSTAAPGVRAGTLLAALGVVAFSFTFPSISWAMEGLGPWSVAAWRAALAGAASVVVLLVTRAPVPDRRHWGPFAVVAGGVFLGYPLLTSLALHTSSTAHAAVVVGLLPLTTAAYAAVRFRTRHSRTFWAAALAGAAVVAGFALQQSGGAPTTADLYLLVALVVCAAGYAEGGRLARAMPGWQVVCWAAAACLPLAAVGAGAALWAEPVHLTGRSVAGLLWAVGGSTLLGMAVWYRGMAMIGVARAGQLQLAQPLLTLLWSVTLLGEHLTPAAPLAAVAVLVCIVVTQRADS
ncbi:DMT family transporter [Streptomyces sp. NPDC049585]|uniref:DMT family transporter n=1 Tax=Streptomyces sp. NPDC049585 TaxID=3155154 RepID=UPI0034331BDA